MWLNRSKARGLGLGRGLEHFGSTGGVDVFRAGGHFAIPQVLHDLEHLGPTGEWALVDLLILVDGHDEFEQLAGDLPFLGRSTNLAAAPAGSAPAIHAYPALLLASPVVAAAKLNTTILDFAYLVHTHGIGNKGDELNPRWVRRR